MNWFRRWRRGTTLVPARDIEPDSILYWKQGDQETRIFVDRVVPVPYSEMSLILSGWRLDTDEPFELTVPTWKELEVFHVNFWGLRRQD